MLGAVLERRVRLLPAAQRALAAAVRARRRRRRRHAAAAGGAVPHRSWSERRGSSPAIGLGVAALAAFGVAAGMIFGGDAEDLTKTTMRTTTRTEDEAGEEGDDAWISLGFIEHHSAQLPRLARPAVRPPRPRAAAVARQSRHPAAPGRAAFRQCGRSLPISDDEDEDDDEDAAPRARKPRAPAKPARRSSGGFQSAVAQSADGAARQRARDREHQRDPGERHAARRRARRFRRARRDHQCAAGPGGDALRARAGARHQIVARHQSRRRHRALDERAVGARRRGVGPQRHRHRTAQSDARESLSARAPGVARIRRDEFPPAALPRQDRSAANPSWSISPACRIC